MSDAFFRIFAQVAREEGLDAAVAAYVDHIPAEKLQQMCKEYTRLAETVSHGEPGIVAGAGLEHWYTGPLDQDKNWNALKRFYQRELIWSDDLIGLIDRSSTKIVASTPPPSRERWLAKGLVVGYVQSGKTTNFTAVIAKAADLKYRLVIVLSGIHNGLRRQTQDRLVGQLKAFNEKAWIELTTSDDDFRRPTMTMASLLHNRGAGTALAVVKKNKAPLTRLRSWIQEAADQNALADLPVLIIDDEADQASIETKAINPLLMEIITALPRCTYIGYTATPFANVLIDPAAEDLYPADFILSLDEPKGYFGTEKVFGRDVVEGDEASGSELDGYDMVRIIPEDDLHWLRPSKRKDIPDFEPAITDSLAAALTWFWMATAARRVRGDEDHSSMLIHTHMNRLVHHEFKGPVVDFRDQLLRDLRNSNKDRIAMLRWQWEDEYSRLPRAEFADLIPVSFDDVLDQLENVVAVTRVVVDNSSSDDRLDYTEASQIVIAIGGNTLSRGLTLEGLVVSFFVRTSTAYDTLLQMARWFGFRRGYEDLPRIWMTQTLQEWFRHLATVEREIRADIERYEKQGFTPTELGVRIRTHPKLAVTAKMGAAKPVAASFSDRRVQTRYFYEKDGRWLRENIAAADRLIGDVRADGAQAEADGAREAVLFRGVRAERIQQFLTRYRVHKDSPDLNTELLRSYIDRELGHGKLERWTVAVMAKMSESGAPGSVTLGGISFGHISRSALKSSSPERVDIKTLMSKDHMVIDLAISSADARRKLESSLRDLRNEDRVYRNQGLLLLYPIDPYSLPAKGNEKDRRPMDAVDDVIGLALVFPESGGTKDDYVAVDLSGLDIDLEPDADSADSEGELAAEAAALFEEN